MANPESLENLPLTPLELSLKRCMERRPDIREQILTPVEFAEYTRWMAENYGDKTHFTLESIPSFAGGSDLLSLAGRILANPSDKQAFSQLGSGFDHQSEERYISGHHDISVARMLRYMPGHWHSNRYFEICYSFSGSCPVHFPDGIVTVRPGTVLIISPGVVHSNPCYADDCILLLCMIRSSTFDQVFWNQLPPENLMSTFFRKALGNGQSTSYLQFDTGDDPDIRRLIRQIYLEYQNAEPYSAQMLNVLMSAAFLLLLRRYESTARLPRSEQFFWKQEFSAIFSYLQVHYASTSLAEVARRFHYSERQISRIVRSCTGQNYAQLILKLRMQQAGRLLRQRELSMEAIASAVGYSSVSSFYRAFTGYYGCSPAEYGRLEVE